MHYVHTYTEGQHWAQCVRVRRRCKEEHKLTERQSWANRAKLEWGCRLGSTIQDSHRIWKSDTSIVFYLFVFVSVTCPRNCCFIACFYVTINMYFCFNIARDLVTGLKPVKKNALQTTFCCETECTAGKFIKQNATHARFSDCILMGRLSYWYSV